MTTPTNEEVRRQFEAWAKDVRDYSDGEIANLRSGSGYHLMSDLHLPWLAYQAALRSPAVAGLVEALGRALKWTELIPPGEPLRGECVADLDFARAALAPFTTGAGHVE